MGIGQAITMPLFFSSSALYPTRIMPGWLQVISRINPLSYEVEGRAGATDRHQHRHLAGLRRAGRRDRGRDRRVVVAAPPAGAVTPGGAEGVWGERLPPRRGGFRGVVPPGRYSGGAAAKPDADGGTACLDVHRADGGTARRGAAA